MRHLSVKMTGKVSCEWILSNDLLSHNEWSSNKDKMELPMVPLDRMDTSQWSCLIKPQIHTTPWLLINYKQNPILTEWILGNDGFGRNERSSDTLVIDGHHTELILLSGIEFIHWAVRVPTELGHRHPATIFALLLDLVVINRRTTVILEYQIKWMVFQATILHCKAILGRGRPGLMRWILVWIMPQMQDCSLDLLTSSPLRYHCANIKPHTGY